MTLCCVSGDLLPFSKARKLSPGGKTSHCVPTQYNYGRALRWYREVKRQLTDMQNYFIAKRHAVTNFLCKSFPRNNWNIIFIMNTYAQKNRLAFICLKWYVILRHAHIYNVLTTTYYFFNGKKVSYKYLSSLILWQKSLVSHILGLPSFIPSSSIMCIMYLHTP